MKSRIFIPTLILFLAVNAAVFSGGGGQKADDGRLNVVTTIGMIADTAENIGGAHVNVTALMGPGVDPHLYKASEGDVSRLSRADLILYNGLHLEAKMGEVLERLDGRIRTVAVAEVIDETELKPSGVYENAFDPHVWFDVKLWAAVTEAVKLALIEADPSNAAAYESNHAVYAAKLEELDEYVSGKAASVPEAQRILVTAHDAFSYFGRAYGFAVRGLQGISTVSEAGIADVRGLADFIAERKIPAIFIESSVPRKNVEALQAAVKSRGFAVEIGGELFSDAMGTPGTEEGTYIGMVRHNIDTITGALGGE